MKVEIGNYPNWIGPYQIADALCFWVKEVEGEYGLKSKPDWVHDFGTWLSGGENKDSWLSKACQWVHNKKKRKVKVHLDPWDTWNMDGTLSFIILPMLKQLKEKQHGGPLVADEDVPDNLGIRSTDAPAKENDWDIDANHFKRWDWVMSELIWTFTQLHPDTDWEDQYHTGHIDLVWKPVDKDGNEVSKEDAKLYQMENGPNDTHHWDKDGFMAHSARIDNGLLLLGKYFRCLWD